MKKLFCLAACALLFAACGKKSNPVANATQALKERDLQASFTSKCSTDLGDMVTTFGGIKSSHTVFDFKGNNVTKKTVYYNQLGCDKDPAIEVSETGTIDIDKSKKTNDGGYNINMDFSKTNAKTVSEDGAKTANDKNFCGKKDWASNSKDIDVSAQAKNGKLNMEAPCIGSQSTRHVANIYRLDNGTLYLGSDASKAVADKDRPAKLDMLETYSKH